MCHSVFIVCVCLYLHLYHSVFRCCIIHSPSSSNTFSTDPPMSANTFSQINNSATTVRLQWTICFHPYFLSLLPLISRLPLCFVGLSTTHFSLTLLVAAKFDNQPRDIGQALVAWPSFLVLSSCVCQSIGVGRYF